MEVTFECAYETLEGQSRRGTTYKVKHACKKLGVEFVEVYTGCNGWPRYSIQGDEPKLKAVIAKVYQLKTEQEIIDYVNPFFEV